ncbi:MAG: hypothetical protein ACRCV6_03640 [Formosimonas sp.]
MLSPLKTLEIKLAHLLEYVAQLQAENAALRHENHHLVEQMQQAQQNIDQIIRELETQGQS